jgi:hypothetical protein
MFESAVGRAIERHWRTHLPKKVKALEAAGTLQKMLEEAERLTLDAESELLRRGTDAGEWALLPAEDAENEEPD